MPKTTAADRNRAAAERFAQDQAVWTAVAPRIREILGFVPRDGLVSVLSNPFRTHAADFLLARQLVAERMADPHVSTRSLDFAEAQFADTRDALVVEIERYQTACAAVLKVAMMQGHDRLADRALAAVLDYSTFRTFARQTSMEFAA